MSRTTASILKDAEETLATAQMGLMDLADPKRLRLALRNVVVFGRAFTNVLQNLRSTETEFDSWYQPIVEQMRNDALLRYFYALRSEILKEGLLRTSGRAAIRQLDLPSDLSKFGAPPANARSFFMGDQNGGTGWEVLLPGNTIEKYYISIPDEIGESWASLPSPPKDNLGHSLSTDRVGDLAGLYVAYLEGVLTRARKRFATDVA